MASTSATDFGGMGFGYQRKVATAPNWRKTRAEKVDSKVEKLFESYKLIDQAAWA